MMLRVLFCLLLAIVSVARGEDRLLERAEALPLALEEDFDFRKVKTFLNDPKFFKPTQNAVVRFERERANFGAITNLDQRERYGNSFTFFWRAKRRTDLTVRFEYRQQNLGPYVQAREMRYDDVKGSHKTKFAVTGDDYLQDGRVTAWRALLVENGKVVALTQSFLWN